MKTLAVQIEPNIVVCQEYIKINSNPQHYESAEEMIGLQGINSKVLTEEKITTKEDQKKMR